MPIGVWQKQGTVVPSVASDAPGQPIVIFEGGAKILSGNVFKMWFSTTNGMAYAESSDGITWTRFGSNPVVAGAGFLSTLKKSGSTYYLYVGDQSVIKAYTSTDGTTFALQNASAVVLGGIGVWDHTQIAQLNVLTIDGSGTWWGYYSGKNGNVPWGLGLVTSTDGINWTKSGSNPISGAGAAGIFSGQSIAGTFYAWSQAVLSGIPGSTTVLPSDLVRFKASAPGGPWTSLGTPTFYRTTAAEGVNTALGQVADPSLISVNGTLYLYYSTLSNGNAPSTQVISLATAPSTSFAQLVNNYEGVLNIPITTNAGLALQLKMLASDNFQRANANPIGGNWTPLGVAGFGNAQLLSNSFTAAAAGVNPDSFWNALAFPNDQWAQVTIATCTSSDAGILLRGNTAAGGSGYRFIVNTINNTWIVQSIVAGAVTNISTGNPITFTPGDVFTAAAIGTQLSFYQNGNLLGTFTDSNVSSGSPGAIPFCPSVVTSVAITAWSGGSVVNPPNIIVGANVYSVPDSRAVTPTTPNASRTVQATVIYDVPKVDSRAQGAPVDSRAQGAPADSRAAGQAPQNSRTPGTFGPGE